MNENTQTKSRGDILAERIEYIKSGVAGGWLDKTIINEISEALADYRKPEWALGRSINGFTLAEGQEWHRNDWTQDMLPDGWRPLLADEEAKEGDEHFKSGFGPWTSNFVGGRYGFGTTWCRTRRPPPILTPAQIADGWLEWHGGECPVWGGSQLEVIFRDRCNIKSAVAFALRWGKNDDNSDIIAYRPDPYEALKKAHSEGKVIQFNFKLEYAWDDCPEGCVALTWCYPPENYRVKPEPVMVPLGPEDITPGSVFRRDAWTPHAFRALVSASEKSVCLGAAYGDGFLEFSFLELKENEFKISRDGGKTWHKCEKELL